MTGTESLIPCAGILDIDAYQGGLSEIEGRANVIKLSSNEGALGPSPKALEAYRSAGENIARYPDGSAMALRTAIGARFGLDPARIVCGAGSDEILGLLARGYAGVGDEVIYSQHGFLMYPIAAKAVGATPVKVGEKNLCADIDGMIKAAQDKTKIVYLANPNNPTGSVLSGDVLRALRKGLPSHVLLVIDAAYAEYVTDAAYEAGAALVDEFDNVIMTRTFSKIFGLGGLRLGWAYGPASVIDILNRLRMPFNVSSIAQATGIAALEDTAHTDKACALNSELLASFSAALRDAGIEAVPSVGNFVLARFPAGVAQAEAADVCLQENDILVRRMGGYGLPDSLRITIGLSAQMDKVARVLADFMKDEGHKNG
ncbi:MAG: histidinol-phosphate transaminase [Alphaproteobacteria bacterium]|jgi:histidinol-phosphate aminotransferase